MSSLLNKLKSQTEATSSRRLGKSNNTGSRKTQKAYQPARSARPSRRHTNNAQARLWRDRFNAHVGRLIAEIEAIKTLINPDLYDLTGGVLDYHIDSLTRVQENVETYKVKGQSNLQHGWLNYIKAMNDNIKMFKESKLFDSIKKK